MTSFLWSLGGFFIVLTPIILIHELGHFLAARLANIRIDEFGLGFPPRALKLAERNGTVYSLNWIPLGGFVRPAGEDDPSVPGGLAAASKRARLFVLSAGAGANFLMALVVFWIAFMIGTPLMAASVGDVNPGSPAQVAGLQAGDLILEVENTSVVGENSQAIGEIMARNAGQPVAMVVERDGQLVTVEVVPRQPNEYNAAVEGPIGVGLIYVPTGERVRYGPVESATNAAQSVWRIISLTVQVPAMIASGEISAGEARPVSVVGISQIAGQQVEVSVARNTLFPVLNIVAFVSVALGFTNLLPIPALDGGRILFVLIEAVRGRRIEPEREGLVHVVGMIFLLSLMVLMIVQDIVNPIF